MRKRKFDMLCDDVLMPRLRELVQEPLADIRETLDLMSQELIRIDDRLDHLEADRHESDEDN